MKDGLDTYVIIAIVLIIALISGKFLYDYREQELTDVIHYEYEDFSSLEMRNKDQEIFTDDQEAVDELLAFLDQYQIKKIRDPKWESEYIGEQFLFTINHSKAGLRNVIREDQAQIGDSYYKFVNGPIDMDWVKKFTEKIQ